MPKFAESILALFAGRERAAALYGDLLEMSATRSRLWFAAAYARTLIALGWRTALAFVVSYAYSNSVRVFKAIYTSMHWLFRWVPYASYGYQRPLWDQSLIPLVSLIAGLYSLAPFLMLRFGLRDRVTQLAALLFLIQITEYSSRLLVAVPVEALIAVVVLAALCLRPWRRPMAALALSLSPRYAYFETLQYSSQLGLRPLFADHHFVGYVTWFALSFAIPIVLCLRLHRWSLSGSLVIPPTHVAGAAHA